jgi:hypothetical protein
MNTKQIFWGVFLISIGILVLLRNYLNYDFDIGDLWKLWPLLFVLLGINLMIKNNLAKSAIAGVTALILAVALYASVLGFFGWFRNDVQFRFDDDDYEVSEYTAPYEKGMKNASLRVEVGAGSFILEQPTDDLFNATVEGRKNNYSLTTNVADNTADIRFQMKNTKLFLKRKNRVEFKLNSEPVWDLKFEIGAAAVDFDLSRYNVENLDVDMGAASFKLKLGGNQPESRVSIEAGASSIDILIPEEVGCEIRTDVNLSSRKFRDFSKIKDNLYRTDNFDTAGNKILLELKSGVSSINVSRYSW